MPGFAPPSDAPGAIDGQYRRLSLLLHQAIQIAYVPATSNPQYIGWAEPGTATSDAKWRICLLTYDGSGNVIQIQWAHGSIAYAEIWDLHTALPYS